MTERTAEPQCVMNISRYGERDPAESLLDDVCVATLGLCERRPVIQKVGAQLHVCNSDRTDFIKGKENTRINFL